jgi:DNA-binding NarL/FixJ family response regulator
MTTADEAYDFSDLELKVLGGIPMGLSNREIAQTLGITRDVAQNAMCAIFHKAGVSNRLELLLWVKTALNRKLPRENDEA